MLDGRSKGVQQAQTACRHEKGRGRNGHAMDGRTLGKEEGFRRQENSVKGWRETIVVWRVNAARRVNQGQGVIGNSEGQFAKTFVGGWCKGFEWVRGWVGWAGARCACRSWAGGGRRTAPLPQQLLAHAPVFLLCSNAAGKRQQGRCSALCLGE